MSEKKDNTFLCVNTAIMVFSFFILTTISGESLAQTLHSSSFEFLNIPISARQVGLGGVNITSCDKDPNVFFSNPAILNKELNNYLSFNYTPYFGKTNYLNSTLVKDFKTLGTWGASVNYLDYGDFEGYDATGDPIGKFNSRDYALVIGNAHTIDNFSLGGSIKLVGSSIAQFYSSALLFDIGGIFHHPTEELKIGMTIKNIGFSFKKYTSTSDFSLPFDVQFGGSYKPKHMPLRISLTLHHLNKFKVSNVMDEERVPIADQIFRHFVFGTEILLSKNMNVRFGYNHQRRKELKLEEGAPLSGFSVGLMFRVKAFELAYSRGMFNPAGSQNTLTLITDLNYFLNKN